MYKLFRDTHLVIGLFSAVFLLAYGLSAAQMAYPIYRPRPHPTVTTLTIPDDVDVTPRPFAKWLMDTQDFRGDLKEVETTSTAVMLFIVRPATTHRIEYARASRTATVTTGRSNFIGMLNRLHHVGGLWHGYWAINAWGWFLAAVSVCLILLALSGVYMWFKRHRERRIGTIVFAAGLVWGVTMLVLIRMA